jgi:hypothetical protein
MRMATKRTQPEAAKLPSRTKRPAPTIDLTAREVAPPPTDPPQPDASEAASEPQPQAEAPDVSSAMPQQPEAPEAAATSPAQDPPRSSDPLQIEPQAEPKRESASVSASTASTAQARGSASAAAAPRRASFNVATVVGGVIGATVVVLIMFGLWRAGLLASRDDGSAALQGRIAGLETQLHALQNRPPPAPAPAPAAAPDTKALDALSARVGKIEQTLAKLPPSDPAMAAQLAAADSAMKSLGITLAALNRRVNDVDGKAAQALKSADAAEKAVTALQASAKEAAANAPAPVTHADLDKLEKRVAALEQSAQAAREHIAANTGIDNAARLALSAAVLRDAVFRGAPYAVDLASVKSLGADAKTLAALAPFAAAGLPHDQALAHELSALIPAMLKASGAQAPSGFLSRLEANADKLVHIRPLDAPPGNDPSDVLARIEIDAARVKIPAALADLAKLPDAVRAPAAAWIETVKARQAALLAARQFAADTARQLGRK